MRIIDESELARCDRHKNPELATGLRIVNLIKAPRAYKLCDLSSPGSAKMPLALTINGVNEQKI